MNRTIGERIRARRLELGWSVEKVAKALGKDRATVYRYEGDEIENMSLGVLVPLARILGVTPTYLLEGVHAIPTKRVPVLGTIAAGEPILASEDYGEYIEVNGDAGIDFCLRVAGDSMIDARIVDGDLVFVRRQPAVENGDIAVVLIDDEATLKRVYLTDNGVILKPENAKYQPTFYTAADFKDVKILGRAILFQSKL